MAKAKPVDTSMTKYDAKLAALAAKATQVQSSVGGVGNFVSIRGGVLSYQGAQIPQNKMNVVILHAILENQWYDQAYDPDNPTSPACYAFGDTAKEMAPHENSPSPQNEACPSCPQMQFGSADRGKGKACKAVQRIALITEKDLEEIEGAEIAYMKLPFYSTLEFAAYTRQLAELYKKPPLAFVTEISVVPDPKSQFRVKFRMSAAIEEADAFEALINAQAKAEGEIAFPYPEITAEAPKPARQNGAVRRTQKATPGAGRTVPPVAATPVKVGLRKAVKPSKF